MKSQIPLDRGVLCGMINLTIWLTNTTASQFSGGVRGEGQRAGAASAGGTRRQAACRSIDGREVHGQNERSEVNGEGCTPKTSLGLVAALLPPLDDIDFFPNGSALPRLYRSDFFDETSSFVAGQKSNRESQKSNLKA